MQFSKRNIYLEQKQNIAQESRGRGAQDGHKISWQSKQKIGILTQAVEF
jgi:hypothetical protein